MKWGEKLLAEPAFLTKIKLDAKMTAAITWAQKLEQPVKPEPDCDLFK